MFGVFNYYYGGIGYVYVDFDYGGGYQNVEFVCLEMFYYVIFFGSGYFVVQQVDVCFGKDGFEVVGELGGCEQFQIFVFFNQCGDYVCLLVLVNLVYYEVVGLLVGGVLNQFGFNWGVVWW